MSDVQKISPPQIRGARAMLNLSQSDLAELALVSVETLKRLEGMRAGISVGKGVSADALGKVRAAIEAAGVEFIAENGGGAGVRLEEGQERRPILNSEGGDIAALADELRADFDQPILECRERPILDQLRRRQRAKEVAEVVVERLKPKVT